MSRESLIRSKDYVMAQIQLGLLNIIGGYKDKKKLKDYQLANELGVSKGYVSQILHATFDHKISKVVDLAMSCNKMPLIFFVDIDKFVENDAKDMIYDIFPIVRARNIIFEDPLSYISKPVGATKATERFERPVQNVQKTETYSLPE